MTPEESQQTETKLDAIADRLSEWLDADSTQNLKQQLAELSEQLGFSINLELNITAFDETRENPLPLLQTGLATRAGSDPYQFWSDSSPMRYVANGEITVVPHDRCPVCWSPWDFKNLHPTCETCGSRIGHEVKLLIDSDRCPSCQIGTVTADNPKCDRCDFEVNPDHVNWG